jgi:DNA-binding protein YbaB
VVVSAQPTDARFAGSAAGGQTRAVVDGTGRLVELTVDALLLRRPPRGVADAILGAVAEAQDAADRERARAVDQTMDQGPDGNVGQDMVRDITSDLEAAERETDRRLSELSAIVSDLIRYRDRPR